jgi:spermidine/putrescine-binding protein
MLRLVDPNPILEDPMTHFSSTRLSKLSYAFAAAAALAASMAAFPAFAQDQTVVAPTTGSHIDPNARPQMLAPIQVGGAIEVAKAVPLDASEARVARPQIEEVDAAEWLPPAEIDAAQ